MDLLITIATYVLGFFAVVLTIGFIAWLVIGYHAVKNYKKHQENVDRMTVSFKASLDEANKSMNNNHVDHDPFKDMYK